ncbi:MAG: hypothetical protein ACYTBJ_22225 [Planctomycetota bacterium]|jgi:catechol 2,3-dioxygenase-like lactoylglutathione lyase family enzyme
MGRVGVVETFERTSDDGEEYTDVKADLGGGEIATPTQYGPPGDDSPPLAGDLVATTDIPGDAGGAAVGFADPVNPGKAEGGEKRLVGRDADGNEVCEVWLKGDGSIRMENEEGFVELGADGVVNINDNFTVDP